MTRETLLKYGSLALAGALVAVAVALEPTNPGLAAALAWAAGAVKGAAFIKRPGDVKGL